MKSINLSLEVKPDDNHRLTDDWLTQELASSKVFELTYYDWYVDSYRPRVILMDPKIFGHSITSQGGSLVYDLVLYRDYSKWGDGTSYEGETMEFICDGALLGLAMRLARARFASIIAKLPTNRQ